MNVASFLIGIVLPYIAVALFLVSIGIRINRWATSPHPLKWSLYPMPADYTGQIKFMLKEILSFRALLHNNRKLWAGSWLFHIGMALIILWFITFVLGLHAGIVLRAGLAFLIVFPLYLFFVRLASTKMRTISSPLEYFNLLIFIAIGILGILLLSFNKPDPTAVRQYFISLILLHPAAPPESSIFLSMLAITEFFMIYFPNSRMLHMISKYFTYHKISWESH